MYKYANNKRLAKDKYIQSTGNLTTKNQLQKMYRHANDKNWLKTNTDNVQVC